MWSAGKAESLCSLSFWKDLSWVGHVLLEKEPPVPLTKVPHPTIQKSVFLKRKHFSFKSSELTWKGQATHTLFNKNDYMPSTTLHHVRCQKQRTNTLTPPASSAWLVENHRDKTRVGAVSPQAASHLLAPAPSSQGPGSEHQRVASLRSLPTSPHL